MPGLGALHLVKHTGAKHTATVIFFHGSGSSGHEMKEWVRMMVKNFQFPNVKVMYPTAPLQPYTAANGGMSNVWFDRSSVDPNVPEKLDSIANIEVEVRKLIQNENDAGIPTNRIIIGGFSMGGALSLHIGYRYQQSLAGVFVFGSFLSAKSAVYDELRKNQGARLPPLLQIQGNSDDMVHHDWAQTTFNELKALGVEGSFHTMPKLGHSVNRRGLQLIKEFIEEHLP